MAGLRRLHSLLLASLLASVGCGSAERPASRPAESEVDPLPPLTAAEIEPAPGESEAAPAEVQSADTPALAHAIPLADDPITGLAIGAASCAVRASGRLQCWHYASLLVPASTPVRRGPMIMPGFTDIAEIDAEHETLCIRTRAGAVSCIRLQALQRPAAVFQGVMAEGAVQIGVAAGTGCARRADGTVACWGSDEQGPTAPVDVEGIHSAVEIAVGGMRNPPWERSLACARLEDGTVTCWTIEDGGRAGRRSTIRSREPAVQLAVSRQAACALTASGRLHCIGRSPGEASTWRDVVGVYANHTSVCAIRRGDRVTCWEDFQYRPRTIDLAGAVQVVPGQFHTCALVQREGATQVHCWGEAFGSDAIYGAPELRVREPFAIPLDVEATAPMQARVLGADEPLGAVEIDAAGDLTCARRATGEVICWGSSPPRRGDGAATASPFPTFVHGITDAVQIDVGDQAACARRSTGAIVCWGHNLLGELGDGTVLARTAPVEVVGIVDAIDLGSSGCALRAGGEVMCWGALRSGRDRAPSPVASGAIGVVSDHMLACALRRDQPPICWGAGTSIVTGGGYEHTPGGHVTAAFEQPVGDVRQLAIGDDMTCGVFADGRARCWDSRWGRPGRTRGAPYDLGVDNAVEIGASVSDVCVRRANGDVHCFEHLGAYTPPGALGAPTFDHADEIAVGYRHACARRGTDIFCWGASDTAQLGDGVAQDETRRTPVRVRGGR